LTTSINDVDFFSKTLFERDVEKLINIQNNVDEKNNSTTGAPSHNSHPSIQIKNSNNNQNIPIRSNPNLVLKSVSRVDLKLAQNPLGLFDDVMKFVDNAKQSLEKETSESNTQNNPLNKEKMEAKFLAKRPSPPLPSSSSKVPQPLSPIKISAKK
jgi:hypothetical protein